MINTAFVERYNGTDRNRNARKVPNSYCFSKDWDVHNATAYFTTYSHNFCWPIRTLRVQNQNDRWLSRTPAMVVGLTDYLVFERMVELSGRSIIIGHKEKFSSLKKAGSDYTIHNTVYYDKSL